MRMCVCLPYIAQGDAPAVNRGLVAPFSERCWTDDRRKCSASRCLLISHVLLPSSTPLFRFFFSWIQAINITRFRVQISYSHSLSSVLHAFLILSTKQHIMKAHGGRWTKAPRILVFVIRYFQFVMFISFLLLLLLLLLRLLLLLLLI
jgi:hypothetical protein